MLLREKLREKATHVQGGLPVWDTQAIHAM
ncbi:MAG: hypothetical protein ACI8Z1_001645 [Candidatus Azotimanducaceae bacterium]|jgi:hypothetical protein